MVDDNQVAEFQTAAEALMQWEPKRATLVRREAWGDITFEHFETQFNMLFKLTPSLVALPLKLMDSSRIGQIKNAINGVVHEFERMDEYGAEQIVQNRTDLDSNLTQHFGLFIDVARSEYPWLISYSEGQTHWSEQAQKDAIGAKAALEQAIRHQNEAAECAAIARESAGESGSKDFTGGFRKRAEDAEEAVKRWLWTAGGAYGLAVATLLGFFIFHLFNPVELASKPGEAVLYLGWRFGLVGAFVWAAIWSGKNYRANRHNHEVNTHRQICLENMRAFHASAADPTVKDMVVLELTRAAGQGAPTGFINRPQTDGANASPPVVSFSGPSTPKT